MMTGLECVELLRSLVSIPSVSGEEKAAADFLQSWMEGRGWRPERVGNSLLVLHGEGPYLLMNSHLDTVPVCDGWTRDPFAGDVEEGEIRGLGANDAGAAVVAMLSAFDHHVATGASLPVAVAIVEGEETSGKGTAAILDFFRRSNLEYLASVVGEPTQLDIAASQKGLLILELVANGIASHAANASVKNNAIVQLSRDIMRLAEITWDRVDELVGEISVQPTMLRAGSARNQVPGAATAILDIRTTGAYTHSEITIRIAEMVESQVDVVSSRLTPVSTSVDTGIVQAAKQARPQAGIYGSPTMSDMAFLNDKPAIKVGPGKSQRSHTADEFVLVDELLEGRDFYTAMLREMEAAPASVTLMPREVEV